jgi:hypothetical protein
VFFQNLLMICATNGLPWLKTNSRISHDNFFSRALFGIVFSMVHQSIALWLRLDSSSLELNIENIVQ